MAKILDRGFAMTPLLESRTRLSDVKLLAGLPT
jgi:hypothetical protein